MMTLAPVFATIKLTVGKLTAGKLTAGQQARTLLPGKATTVTDLNDDFRISLHL
ncbi:MAG: hypothetical protein HYR56_31410 [Acidobacteria bacterium]|nr:hypothetical protein [Acidobacteriota bacterium]MBI3427540.1 hypothetical protein [Acidobacteriota bacterium]